MSRSEGSEELSLAWAWLQHASDLAASGQLRPHTRAGQVRVPGARSILRSASGVSEVKAMAWAGVRGQRSVSVYTSPQREAVLRLCGWRGDKQLSAHAHSDYLASAARKAAVAIFNLDLRRALRELQAGAASARNDGRADLANVLTMVSVAVSGFSSDTGGPGGDQGSELWREMVSCSLSSLPNPALR